MSSHDGRMDNVVLVVKLIQAHVYGWMIRWSWQYQRLEAWDCRDPARCRVVHATSAAELWQNMLLVELDLWRTLPQGTAPPLALSAAGRWGSSFPVAPGGVPGCTAGLPPSRPGRIPGPRPRRRTNAAERIRRIAERPRPRRGGAELLAQ